jgi:hypothetical protein
MIFWCGRIVYSRYILAMQYSKEPYLQIGLAFLLFTTQGKCT